MSRTQHSAVQLFETGRGIALASGFSPLHEVVQQYKGIPHTTVASRGAVPRCGTIGELASILHFYFERRLQFEKVPLFIFHSTVDCETRPVITVPHRSIDAHFTLTAIGITDPFVDALLITTGYQIMEQMRSKEILVRLNSMGDRNTSEKYFSLLHKTLQKHSPLMSNECARLCRESIVDAHRLIFDEDHMELQEKILTTLRFLSESANTKFKSVLEYLDAYPIPYDLAPELVTQTNQGVHTIFEIVSEDATLHAHGARYDTLPMTLYRRTIPISSVTISVPEKTVGKHQPKKKKSSAAKIFFIHVGPQARFKVLSLLGELYKHDIAVTHRLHYTQMKQQLEEDGRKYPFILIFGQKELESGVIRMRRTDTHAFTTISLNRLDTLKKYLH